jgi:2-polyprenyl-3-methyl-5-hydroxy-6-metoxy-1,4-benzoquinol methylase
MNLKNTCRFCDTELHQSFCDLGMSPLSNAFLTADKLQQMESFYPLHVHVCGECFLVQLQEFESPKNIFHDYAYFSSYSESWLSHARKYTDEMVSRFQFDNSSQVVEIASNDGYLLQYFKKKKIPVLGIEPAVNVAEEACRKGIPTRKQFFGVETSQELVNEGLSADLLIGNNVVAHVPNINDFVAGLKITLNPHGVITLEFPHVLRLIEENQFDTIYHEHFSYFSFITINRIFKKHGLAIFDVEELKTHGGSLRIYGCHSEDKLISESVQKIISLETNAGLMDISTYGSFLKQVQKTKRELLNFLISVKNDGKNVVGYGAPAKGNTLLNYCGIRQDFLDYTVDLNPNKQDHYLPGTHIPVFAPDKLSETKPDYVLILPWNIKEEIMIQMAHISDWGGKFVVPIPKVEVLG